MITSSELSLFPTVSLCFEMSSFSLSSLLCFSIFTVSIKEHFKNIHKIHSWENINFPFSLTEVAIYCYYKRQLQGILENKWI